MRMAVSQGKLQEENVASAFRGEPHKPTLSSMERTEPSQRLLGDT